MSVIRATARKEQAEKAFAVEDVCVVIVVIATIAVSFP